MAEPSAALAQVLQRGAEAVAAALSRATPPAPVYAVGLLGSGEEELDPSVACIGLEPDREAALREETPYGAFVRVWNVSDYAAEAAPEPDLREDPEFVRAELETRRELRSAGVWDPQRYVLNRIARRLGDRRPPWPVTEDFVVFCFDEDFGEDLLANVRFSAPPVVAERLAAKNLLPTDVTQLPGFYVPPP